MRAEPDRMEGDSRISLKPDGKSAELIPQRVLARGFASRVESDHHKLVSGRALMKATAYA
jgi:hypothetical protein